MQSRNMLAAIICDNASTTGVPIEQDEFVVLRASPLEAVAESPVPATVNSRDGSPEPTGLDCGKACDRFEIGNQMRLLILFDRAPAADQSAFLEIDP